jgi:hypothetical protein
MWKFIRRLFVFALIPTIFIILMEITIYVLKDDIFSEGNMGKNYINIGNKYQWVNKIKQGRKIFLAGSSSVRYGLSCSQLNKLSNDTLSYVNLAMSAGDPIEMYFLLKQLDLTGVKTVYLGLDPWIYSKFFYRFKRSYLFLDINFLQALRLSIKMDKPIFLDRYFAFYQYLFPPKKNNNNSNQKVPGDFGSVKLVLKPRNFNTPIFKWFQIDRYGWSQLQFIYLEKIADLCRKKNIGFYTFVPPKRSDYSKIYKSQCKVIHKEYINNLTKVNFRSPIFGKFDQLDSLGDTALFAESFHLNAKGQEVYTEIFYRMTLNKKMIFSQEYSWFNKN